VKGSTHSVLKRPVVTEKSTALREEENQYAFEVALDANKIEIRRAVESNFGVRVLDVRTQVVRGKMKRFRRGFGKKPNWKKAVVTLREGDVIDFFEGA
jgi:large subunit ribosomal protein L23